MAENLKIPLTDFLHSEIPTIALGTVKFGRNTKVKYPGAEGRALPSDQELIELLSRSKELGIKLIDTAPAYGSAEERLGKLLTSDFDFFISTKVGEEFNNDTGESKYIFSTEHINFSVERSLQRLKKDCLDCVLLHCSRNDLDDLKNTPALETLTLLKESGKIKMIGASTSSVEGGLYALPFCDALMVSYNIDYQAEAEVIEKALDKNMSVLLKKTFMSGHIDSSRLKENLLHIKTRFPKAIIVAGTSNPDNLSLNAQILSE